jgi:hypothetical protein
MKKIYLLTGLLFPTYAVSHAQQSNVAQHHKANYFLLISKFKDKKSKPFYYHHNVYLRRHGQLIFPSDSLGFLKFDRLVSTDTVDLVIKSGHHIFSLNKMAVWRLRDGANVAIGTIPKLWKLKSIAEQDNYLPEDSDYTVSSTRYRIAPEGNTIDLTKIDSLKQLVYITCCNYSGSCLMSYRVTSK